MRSLPPINVGKGQLVLPCPEEDLIALANSFIAQDAYRAVAVNLRRSPTLLICALQCYANETGRSPVHARSFLLWAVDQLPEILARHAATDFRPMPFVAIDNQLRVPLKSFAAAKGNRSLRRSLVSLLAHLCDGCCKVSRLKKWVKKTVGTDLRADDLDYRAKSKLYRKIKRRWEATDSPVEVQALFTTITKLQALQAGLGTTLRDEKLAAMKQLAYGASHEINNPLANIASRAQTLLVDEQNPERRRKLATIYEQAMRAHEMISDLMLFAHPTNPRFAATDLYELVKQVVQELQPLLRQSGIRLRVVQYPNCDHVSCDATQMAVAVRALIQNSVEAINSVKDNKGRIDVRVWSKSKDLAAISIVDNGPGVDESATQHIFDPFYSGREAGRGLGFGLSKAWTIITQLHGGQIALVSKDDNDGAEFQITLPRNQPHTMSNEQDNSKTSAA